MIYILKLMVYIFEGLHYLCVGSAFLLSNFFILLYTVNPRKCISFKKVRNWCEECLDEIDEHPGYVIVVFSGIIIFTIIGISIHYLTR